MGDRLLNMKNLFGCYFGHDWWPIQRPYMDGPFVSRARCICHRCAKIDEVAMIFTSQLFDRWSEKPDG